MTKVLQIFRSSGRGLKRDCDHRPNRQIQRFHLLL
uniref:Uncharacterized protein n=1 Tax=Rhizophora mucronata TaxID=61149 RepID=A0A2P2NVN9_RHIMU